MNIQSTHCCGVGEIAYLHLTKYGDNATGEQLVEEFCKQLATYGYPRPSLHKYIAPRSLYTFVGVTAIAGNAVTWDYADAFANAIISFGLGKITRGPKVVNRNSGNSIQMYVWAVDQRKLVARWNTMWDKKHPPQPTPRRSRAPRKK